VLLARRLVESGVTFVTIHTEGKPNGHWDTHSNNFKMLQHVLLPFLDRAVSALLDDLADRGLLDSTLVVVTGDMGRSPKVNKGAGRDHWPQCGFALFAGGGTRPGVVYGTSDKIAAFPADLPVSAGDLVATVYHLIGVDPEATVPDHTGRPTHISHGGQPVRGILA
jgi:arylsulfatase A-like enzyme